MAGKKEIIIHVGAHKTASTFLQEKIFNRLSDIYYTGWHIKNKNLIDDDPLEMDLPKKLMLENPLSIDFDQEKQRIENFIQTIPENKIIYSCEGLFGYMNQSYRDNIFLSDALKKIFPNAKIFLVVRKQDTWLESAYRHLISRGKSISVNKFLNYYKGEFKDLYFGIDHNVIDVKAFNWANFVDNYVKLFGKDRVLVLPYEMFKKNQNEFLTRFYKFADIQPFYPADNVIVNKGLSNTSLFISYYTNFFLQRKLRIIFNKFLKSLDNCICLNWEIINEKIKREIMDLHKESNQKLEELIGIDLKQYGYY
ncbi:MAG: hypothetical protein A2Y25_11890 [Candidatus Melainabacteria bacterium GWF2_37_15]|nr:MAG: hypothetical protein A2Y25_11890 [Candidatus Melainabacteria bacterium GWF2_37_15]